MNSRCILFCGGGSLGHIAPSIAVAEEIRKVDPTTQVAFFCAERKEEERMIHAAGYESFPLPLPRFPRGLSLVLLTFPFLFLASLLRSFFLLRSLRPSCVFCKGGAICVPVAIVASTLRIPIVLHMSDSVPSLGDRFVGRLARHICTGFPTDTLPNFLRVKAEQTGNPVRAMILSGSRDAARRITGFSGQRPVIMIIGGSQGSLSINQEVERIFEPLLALADVLHLTGSGKGMQKSHARYYAREMVLEELPHLYALADIVVTRAGASVLSELAALSKAAMVLPLEGVAHNHQVRNAEALKKANAAILLRQCNLTHLLILLEELLLNAERREALGTHLHAFFPEDAQRKISEIILDSCRGPNTRAHVAAMHKSS